MTKYEKNLSILIVLDEGTKEVRKGCLSYNRTKLDETQ